MLNSVIFFLCTCTQSMSVMEYYSRPVQAEQYNAETSQLVTGHTTHRDTESYPTQVSLTILLS